MYSEKLERLIQLSIEDGVIDETENSVLIKCAKEEGVDIDELTLYVNSLLKKRQRELEADVTSKAQKYEKEKKEAIGNICPKCGKQIPPMSLKCPYCGCEIVNKKGVSSAEELLKKIESISQEEDTTLKSPRDVNDILSPFLLSNFFKNINSRKEPKEQRIANTITLFPVPNTKEDIIEFLSLANAQSTVEIKFINTLLGRLLLLLIGIIILFFFLPDDPAYSSREEQMAEWMLVLGIPIFCIGAFFISRTKDVITSRKAKVIKDAWKTKRKQLLLKGRSITGDSDFQKN